ncbi:MAG: GNAT family N-acetyltransferase [Crocinitomicaceae bacterium]|nr:GNAT family N-acetyltransferase [Crocinitomicaceae bacterium]
MKIREASLGDEQSIYDLVKALAVYEKAPNEVINTPSQIAKDLFEDKICYAYVAEKNNSIIAFALYYVSYSTWKGKSLYLEDLFVLPEYRKDGVGGLLFDEVVATAKRWKVKRMDWQILDWNEPALNFYQKKNAHLDSGWVNGRLFF